MGVGGLGPGAKRVLPGHLLLWAPQVLSVGPGRPDVAIGALMQCGAGKPVGLPSVARVGLGFRAGLLLLLGGEDKVLLRLGCVLNDLHSYSLSESSFGSLLHYFQR